MNDLTSSRQRSQPNWNTFHQQAGFSMIEIMIVVVIIGILAATLVPNLIERPDAARKIRVEQDIRVIESALETYRLDHFNYPSSEDGLDVLVGQYLKKNPIDPWGNPYQYELQNDNVLIYSYGSDGTAGGEGNAADLSNQE